MNSPPLRSRLRREHLDKVSCPTRVFSVTNHARRWSTHYRWVVMVIVLAVGFSLLAVVGVYLKRRYDAKHIPYMVANPSPGFSNSAGILPPAPAAGSSSMVPGPRQSRSAGPGSLASSSRTDIPRGSTPSGNRRLTKGAQTAAGDVEIRQMSRSRP